MTSEWSWCGTTSVGTSHLRRGTECEDYGGCVQTVTRDGPAIILVASDGAGSAKHGKLGARVTTHQFIRSTVESLKQASIASIYDEDIETWLDCIRDRIFAVAQRRGEKPRDFASTLVGCIATQKATLIVHVGDGACVVREKDSQEWEVVSWPQSGEYASTTSFITDDPKPLAQIKYIEAPISDIAVFTDGLERLALDFIERKAHQPFFRGIFDPLSGQPPGRLRGFSIALKRFLDSPRVTERTDDDKTLIIAHRSDELRVK